MRISEEVEKCFKENPGLVNKSLREIATFFMVQGELRYSLLRSTLNHKADFFLNRLFEADEKFARECVDKWKEVAELYEGTENRKHLEKVNE